MSRKQWIPFLVGCVLGLLETVLFFSECQWWAGLVHWTSDVLIRVLPLVSGLLQKER